MKHNTNLILFIISAVFIFLFAYTYNRNVKLKEELNLKNDEIVRIENNIIALSDTLKQWKDKNGSTQAQISGYVLTIEELSKKYSSLFYEQKQFLKEWELKPPKTITEIQYFTNEKIVDFNTAVSQNGSEGLFSFSSDTIFSEGNLRKIQGIAKFKVGYFQKIDSSFIKFDDMKQYANISFFNPEITVKQQMRLITGIIQDPKTKKISVWAKTDYPNITFTGLTGVDILSDESSRKAIKSFRREWGIGVHFGPGISYSYKTEKMIPSINLGIGINFSPKILQFAK